MLLFLLADCDPNLAEKRFVSRDESLDGSIRGGEGLELIDGQAVFLVDCVELGKLFLKLPQERLFFRFPKGFANRDV